LRGNCWSSLKENTSCRVKLREMSRIAIHIRVSDSSPHPPCMANRVWLCGDWNTKQESSFVAIHLSLLSAHERSPN
jgi:hypothetical protein